MSGMPPTQAKTARVIGRYSPVPLTQPSPSDWNGVLASQDSGSRSESPVAPPLPPCKPKPRQAFPSLHPC